MGFFGFLGKAIGIAEGVTGIDVPFVGPGDKFLGGNPAIPGFGSAPLSVSGLPLSFTGSGRKHRGDQCEPGFEFKNGRCRETGIRGAVHRAVPGGSTGYAENGRGSLVGGGMGGWAPVEKPTSRADCGRGAVLGYDGACYDKRNIRNSDRMWPRARRPLLTGGDLNCIAKASRAASRMKTQTKRLQKLGMLPKASRGRR